MLYLNPGLTGTLPTELGTLANLTQLAIQHCQFTGSIPTQLGNVQTLQIL